MSVCATNDHTYIWIRREFLNENASFYLNIYKFLPFEKDVAAESWKKVSRNCDCCSFLLAFICIKCVNSLHIQMVFIAMRTMQIFWMFCLLFDFNFVHHFEWNGCVCHYCYVIAFHKPNGEAESINKCQHCCLTSLSHCSRIRPALHFHSTTCRM